MIERIPNVRFALCLLASAMLAGCSELEGFSNSDPDSPKVGRYQIVNDTKNDGVFWIDTKTGRTEQCMWVAETTEWRCFVVRARD